MKWAVFWRKGDNGLPGRRHCLIVARNVLTGEVKYFVSNRVPGERGITLRWLLRVAFGRWSVEKNHPLCTSRERWCGHPIAGYYKYRGAARPGHLVPAVPLCAPRRRRMFNHSRFPLPPRA